MKTLFTIALALVPAAASAHVTLDVDAASPGSARTVVLAVAHGCDGAATHTLRVVLPDGFEAAEPLPKPGWTSEILRDAGEAAAPAAREIRWSGGPLPDGERGDFAVRGRIGDLPPGTTLPFVVTQLCDGGRETRWDEIAAPGGDAHDLARPAPVLTVVAAGGAASSGGDAVATGTATAGALRIEDAWTRATPPGADVAAGYMTITNTGSAPDTLVGGSVPFAADVQVHETAVEDGVMRMAEVAGGLTIAPGETATFAPGGSHLMFMGLTAAPKAGDTVPVTLRFERAGEVVVNLTVAPIGATRAPEPLHRH